jgi:hypothetical protein
MSMSNKNKFPLTVSLVSCDVRRVVGVSSYDEASREVRAFILAHDLGSSQWYGGDVRRAGKWVATVSYNGRVWMKDGREVQRTP